MVVFELDLNRKEKWEPSPRSGLAERLQLTALPSARPMSAPRTLQRAFAALPRTAVRVAAVARPLSTSAIRNSSSFLLLPSLAT